MMEGGGWRGNAYMPLDQEIFGLREGHDVIDRDVVQDLYHLNIRIILDMIHVLLPSLPSLLCSHYRCTPLPHPLPTSPSILPALSFLLSLVSHT